MVKEIPFDKLSEVEKESIAAIRSIRMSPDNLQAAALLNNPVQIVRHFIITTHGTVQLRITILARELGVGMRTLERAFAGQYQRTIIQFQTEVRLSVAKFMLSSSPPTKVAAVASHLGYRQIQDFTRFFKRQMKQSPSEWRSLQHAKVGRDSDQSRRPSSVPDRKGQK